MRWQHATVLLLLLALLAVPGSAAGVKYLYGNPELSATIAGTNEFAPGAETGLTVVLSNSGVNTHKIVGSTLIAPDDLPNTAKLVTVALKSDDTPFTVKTDPQFLSDIMGGASRTATFDVKVADSAEPGTYTLPLLVTYQYLQDAEEYGSDVLRYNYQTKTVTLPLSVRVTPDLRIEVTDVRSESLNVGTEGYVYLTLKNIGHDTAHNAVAKIVRNGASPLIPTDGSAYLGTFEPGEVVDVKFKVSVANSAEPQSYPLDVAVTYENYEQTTVTSKPVTIGFPVGGKIAFEVVSPMKTLNLGGKSVLEVVYKNTGDATAYNAQARISTVDPFTSSDDTAYLGDLAPGETATARFEVSIDSDGTEKEYGIDSEIRYRDELDNSKISDTMKVPVALQKSSAAFTSSVFIVIVAAVVIGAGYYIFVYRKKK
ncbi:MULTISPECIES: COG1361 S-layer family protein [unclassified Methanoculleus]|uniref:CARDB domain-containing protein n=1 Tax=Methanoculleus palmolei TaxID=72612 RepID=A0ABD8A6K6_9EURY|nr:CARDB domain-containing protein [Methanoculleus sp. UBA377]MDD2472980.1 CARDB domain-containing protein [Methanoculleus sp.]WOX55173.1 CARDB domain-containing protein [Methanoculleus palmolei]